MEQRIEVAATAEQAAAARRTAEALCGTREMTYEDCVMLAATVGLSAAALVALAK